MQPLEQRLTASEERAVSLEKDLIDSQSEIARLDAMLYKLKVSGGGAGDGAGADQGQSPQPPRSKVTSPNSTFSPHRHDLMILISSRDKRTAYPAVGIFLAPL